MNEEHLNEARKALDQLREHLEKLQNPRTLDDIEREWALVLHFSDQVYQRIQHAPVTPVEKKWHANELEIRKSEPLTQYAHQARGVEHHGLQRVTRRGPGMVIRNHGGGHQSAEPGEIVKLVPVTNRGRTYAVPDRFGDMKFNPNNLQEVAQSLEMVMRAIIRGAEHVHENQRLEP